jgi:hypothetical protein
MHAVDSTHKTILYLILSVFAIQLISTIDGLFFYLFIFSAIGLKAHRSPPSNRLHRQTH